MILVTGANGFIGRALMAELAAQKSSVRGTVRYSGAFLPDCDCVVVGEVNGNTDWHDALARGERWYEAHCHHAYQRLARRWQGERNAGHSSVALLVATVNLLWLAPMAWACMQWPQWIPGIVILAYVPLVAGSLALRAGRTE